MGSRTAWPLGRWPNVLLPWAQASCRDFTAPIWMTFLQALELGAHVRKDETGATVVCANRMVLPGLELEPREGHAAYSAHGWRC